MLSWSDSAGQDFFLKKEVSAGLIKKPVKYVVAKFHYQNKSGKPIVIQDVKTTCGCTEVDYPKTPIKLGEKGCIKVRVDMSAVRGYFRKAALVYTNRYSPILLHVKGKLSNKQSKTLQK